MWLGELWNLKLIKWKMLWGKQALCSCCSEHITAGTEGGSAECGEGVEGCEGQRRLEGWTIRWM